VSFQPAQHGPAARTGESLIQRNQQFYDSLWSSAKLVEPDRFNTWPLVQSLLANARTRVEIAPGLRPRLPIDGTHFVDISEPALKQLRRRGGRAAVGSIMSLPFPDRAFDLVCALDIVEHLEDEQRAMSELARVAAPGAAFLFSTPLHPAYWRPFDDFVGHCRRYEPPHLLAMLESHGFAVEQSAAYGMQVKSSRMLDWGIWWMTNYPKRSMWIYNRIMMPLGVKFEKDLALVPGVVPTDGVDEIFLVCRRVGGRS
jgi:SAM-dependent methyltransferase